MGERPLRILQVFRAPVGGLFRHVRDLARGLSERGHDVGIACDSSTGGEAAERQLTGLSKVCKLGIHRLPMPRLPGFGDWSSARTIARHAERLNLDILHGHGAKGGAYARLAGRRLDAAAIYTPHGGSLHYAWATPQGALFLSMEGILLSQTAGLVFVCEYERRVFGRKVGLGSTPNVVVRNGLWPEEFEPVAAQPDAADVLYVGELRRLKGVDVLIEALGHLARAGHEPSATIVGQGGERSEFERRATELRLRSVKFQGSMPARAAFATGRLLVVPSRAESFPYIVLEAVAAGRPVIASDVGGIAEMLPRDRLVPAGDAERLADAILAGLIGATGPSSALRENFEHRFTVSRMVIEIEQFYRRFAHRPVAIAARK